MLPKGVRFESAVARAASGLGVGVFVAGTRPKQQDRCDMQVLPSTKTSVNHIHSKVDQLNHCLTVPVSPYLLLMTLGRGLSSPRQSAESLSFANFCASCRAPAKHARQHAARRAAYEPVS